MQIGSHILNRALVGSVLVGMVAGGGAALAQASAPGGSVSDAQVEANVLRALASSSQLATQSIKTTTVYGTVTLTGTVSDERSMTLAETLASRAPGVQKVVDELTIGGGNAANSAPVQDNNQQQASQPTDIPQQGSNPQLQSDGTMAPAADQNQTAGPDQQSAQAPEPGYVSPPAPAAPSQPQYSQQQSQYPNGGDGQGGPPVYRQPYAGARQPYYAQQQQAPPPPYGAQEAGKAVTIPPGSLVRVRLNEGLYSKHVQPGALFDGVVLNDVIADGEVAIPRGAAVQGTVVQAKDPGALGGKGGLALELNSVSLSGRIYPLVTDDWTHAGRDNAGRTASNVIGLGALGALIGAAAGGGPGAAIGAVAGGATGVGVSAAQGRGQVIVPAEAILSFHLNQAAGVTTVSQAEMDRLAYSAQQSNLQRRPPPPGYYPRPVGYPYPY